MFPLSSSSHYQPRQGKVGIISWAPCNLIPRTHIWKDWQLQCLGKSMLHFYVSSIIPHPFFLTSHLLCVGCRNLPLSYVVYKWYTQHWFLTIYVHSVEFQSWSRNSLAYMCVSFGKGMDHILTYRPLVKRNKQDMCLKSFILFDSKLILCSVKKFGGLYWELNNMLYYICF